MLQQVSVFMENYKGSMYDLITQFSGKSLNLTGFVAIDVGEYGIVRLLVSDAKKAQEILTEAGYFCKQSRVMGVEIADEPGALEYLMETLKNMGVNIDYMYMSYNRLSGWPTVIMHCDQMDEVEAKLRQMGYSLV